MACRTWEPGSEPRACADQCPREGARWIEPCLGVGDVSGDSRGSVSKAVPRCQRERGAGWCEEVEFDARSLRARGPKLHDHLLLGLRPDPGRDGFFHHMGEAVIGGGGLSFILTGAACRTYLWELLHDIWPEE